MKAAKQIALYVCGALAVAIWATIIEGLALLGNPAHLVPYPAERLCRSVKPGMELNEVETRIYQMGTPGSIDYHGGQLVVFSSDSGCILDFDPATKRIAKISISGPPAYF